MSIELVQQNPDTLPDQAMVPEVAILPIKEENKRLLQDGTISELEAHLEKSQAWNRDTDIPVEFHDLTLAARISNERIISTAGTMLWSMLFFWMSPKKKDIDILSHLTGRILPRKLTLVIGPPGSGKSGRYFPTNLS